MAKLSQAPSRLRMAAPLLRPTPSEGGKNAAYYQSAAHRAWAEAVKRRDGYRCVRCGARGRLFADHIVEIEDGGAPLDPDNGETLCQADHNAKTAEARRARLEQG